MDVIKLYINMHYSLLKYILMAPICNGEKKWLMKVFMLETENSIWAIRHRHIDHYYWDEYIREISNYKKVITIKFCVDSYHIHMSFNNNKVYSYKYSLFIHPKLWWIVKKLKKNAR